MDINSYIRHMANVINESKDWEVGEDDYDAEQEFKAQAQYQKDKEDSEKELHSKKDLEKDVQKEAMSIDDILAGKSKDPGTRNIDPMDVEKVEIWRITVGEKDIEDFEGIEESDTAYAEGIVLMKDGDELPFSLEFKADDIHDSISRLRRENPDKTIDDFDAIYDLVRHTVDPTHRMDWWYNPSNPSVDFKDDEAVYGGRGGKLKEAASIDDILGNKLKASGPASTEHRGVKDFEVKEIKINGTKVDKKSLSGAIYGGGDEETDDEDDFEEGPSDDDLEKIEASGAMSILPTDKIRITGKISFRDGTKIDVDEMEIEGSEVPEELKSLTANKTTKGGVNEFYALTSLMLKKNIKDQKELAGAMDELYDRMNKELEKQIPKDDDKEGDDDDSGEIERGDSRFKGKDMDFTEYGYYQSDDAEPVGVDVGYYTNESVGRNFMNWSRMPMF